MVMSNTVQGAKEREVHLRRQGNVKGCRKKGIAGEDVEGG